MRFGVWHMRRSGLRCSFTHFHYQVAGMCKPGKRAIRRLTIVAIRCDTSEETRMRIEVRYSQGGSPRITKRSAGVAPGTQLEACKFGLAMLAHPHVRPLPVVVNCSP
jgi:hypothetical protein